MITSIYAALLGFLLIGLSVRTIRLRRKIGVAIGSAGNPLMERAMRVQANFCEYVPLALILVYFSEQLWSSALVAHALGATLFVGRLLHAFGVSNVDENLRFRVTGMVLTFGVIGVAAARVLAASLLRLS
jgi:uncharacterized membrane protein YecN with MAPEG domain